MIKVLRQKIEETTESEETDTTTKVTQVLKLIPGIRQIPEPSDWKYKVGYRVVGINCFAYAFCFGKSDSYRKEVHSIRFRYQADSNFIRFLLQHSLIQQTMTPKQGDIVIYFDEHDFPTHAGIVLNSAGRILSKWSRIGIFEHELWQVPAFYGTNVLYFNPLELSTLEKHFFGYIDTKTIKIGNSSTTIRVERNFLYISGRMILPLTF